MKAAAWEMCITILREGGGPLANMSEAVRQMLVDRNRTTTSQKTQLRRAAKALLDLDEAREHLVESIDGNRKCSQCERTAADNRLECDHCMMANVRKHLPAATQRAVN